MCIESVCKYLHRFDVSKYTPNTVANDEVGMVRNLADLRQRDVGYSQFGFNDLISDRIGFHRNLPDTRHERLALLLIIAI